MKKNEDKKEKTQFEKFRDRYEYFYHERITKPFSDFVLSYIQEQNMEGIYQVQKQHFPYLYKKAYPRFQLLKDFIPLLDKEDDFHLVHNILKDMISMIRWRHTSDTLPKYDALDPFDLILSQEPVKTHKQCYFD